MKTLLKLGLVVAVIMTCFTMYNLNSQAGPIITVKLDIGKKSKNCTGFGVCSVTIGAELAMRANGTGQLEGNRFSVKMQRGLGNPEAQTIPTEEPIKLKANGREFTIMPGEHKIERGRGGDTIHFLVR